MYSPFSGIDYMLAYTGSLHKIKTGFTVCCHSSLEPSRRDGSNNGSQNTF